MNKDSINPIKSYKLFNNKVKVALFGKPYDWNISRHKPGSTVFKRIANFTKTNGVRKILAPYPSNFNARICDYKDLKYSRNISSENKTIELYRGCYADGTAIKKGEAFWLSPADCPTVIAHDVKSGKTIVAHAGRNSLIDRKRIDKGRARKHESVIDTIMARLSNVDIKNIRVFVVSGISADNFLHLPKHSKHGESNKKMVEDVIKTCGKDCIVGDKKHGKLSLLKIIKSQFKKYGIKPSQIKSTNIDTYSDRDKDGKYIWWSNRRGDKMKRNGVMVIARQLDSN